MINEDQITALAREYAEECAKGFAPIDMPNCLKNEATGILVCNAEDMLKWLLRRYCLVEKKDVEAKYQEAKERYFNPDDEIEKTMYGGRMSMLEYLFPEIAKEVEG